MQHVLTASIELITIGFAFIMVLDFVTGLKRLCPTPAQPQSEPQNEPQSEPQNEPEAIATTAPQEEPATAPQAHSDQPATLQWLEQVITPDGEETEAPNVIELARTRQPKAATLEVVEQPVLDLTAVKLYKLHNHSVVRVSDLPIEIPTTIKRYKLHKREVVRLVDIEALTA